MRRAFDTAQKPATELPWTATKNAVVPKIFGATIGMRQSADLVAAPGNAKDATYIAHAANAYPEAVQALRYYAAIKGPMGEPARAALKGFAE